MERVAAVAGAFYPGDSDGLRKLISGYIARASPETPKGALRGIIVPHAGYVYSAPVAAYGYKLIQKARIPQRIILLGPSHYALFPGMAESGYTSWRTPLGETGTFSIGIPPYPSAHEPEHSLEVQMPFLQHVLEGKKFAVCPILTGEIAPEEGAAMLEPQARDSFFVVSSDLSHYMPYAEAAGRDRKTIALMESLDVDGFVQKGDACGKAGIAIIMALAKKKGWRVKLLHYANSGDTAGPKDAVVGYAALAIVEGR